MTFTLFMRKRMLCELGVNTQIQWGLPPSLQQLETRTVGLPILSLAEVGTTVSADHLLQMATMPLEHKPTALGIPYRPIPRGIVPKPLALANNCVLQPARTVLISSLLHFPLSQLSSLADPHWPLPEFLGPAKQDRSRSCLPGSQSPPTCVLELPIRRTQQEGPSQSC